MPGAGWLAALGGARLFDVVLAATAVECLLLAALGARSRRLPAALWLPFLGAGAALALAARLAFGGRLTAAGAALLASLALHAWHLRQLWRRPGAGRLPD